MTSRIAIGTVLIIGSLGTAAAQVPRYQKTPFAGINGLQSLSAQTRQTSALGLARFRRDPGVITALIGTLHQDPSVAVRQSAAAALSKMGTKARDALVYASVCDPDAGIRTGLAKYAKRAKVQCHETPKLADNQASLPNDEQRLIAYTQHPSPATRLAAAKELVKQRSTRGYRAVWKLMTHDPVWKVRRAAIRMLTRVYRNKLLSVLRYVLTRDPDYRVRMVALEALAFLKPPSAVTDLANSVKFEPMEKMRRAAVRALQIIGSKGAAQALIAICQSHQDEVTRAAAVRALSKLKAHAGLARPVLAQVLSQDRSGKVRAEAMRALDTDRSPAACRARARRINDPEPDVRRAVVEQLARCSARIARPALERAARSDADAGVRLAAVKLLIKAGVKRSASLLTSLLANDASADIRRVTLEALVKKLSPKQYGQAVAKAARSDGDAVNRVSAVQAVSKCSALVAVPALVAVLGSDRDERVRLAAASALSKFKDAQAYKALRKAASEDASDEVKRTAAKGAAKSPAQKAWVDALLPQTIDPNASVRLEAVKKLCELHVPRTYRALIRALWIDASPPVRMAVATCFGNIDHPLVDIGLSVAHATDSDPGAIAAVESAQKQRVERLQRLLQQAESNNATTRLQAVKQLRPSPNPQVRRTLDRRLLKDESVDVRRAAAVGVYRYMDREALNKLLRSSNSEPDPMLRRQVSRLYDRLRTAWATGKKPLSINQLVIGLRSRSRRAAVWSAKALGAIHDKRALPHLKQRLTVEDNALRYAVVVALAALGDKEVITQAAKDEKNEQAKAQLIQLSFLLKAGEDKILEALRSSDTKEIFRGLEAASITQVTKAVPWLVRLAMAHVSKGVRQAAVRTLATYDLPLAEWAIRVAAQHDASKRLRKQIWQWAVQVDASGNS